MKDATPDEVLASSKRLATFATLAAILFGLGVASMLTANTPADGEPAFRVLTQPQVQGEMGFVVQQFSLPVIDDPTACPQGPTPKLREAYLLAQSPAERARLSLKEHEAELTRRWQSEAFGPNSTNICSQPELFDRPLQRTVQSRLGWGLDLDGDGGVRAPTADSCAQQDFETPTGEKGIDNQEYRAMGCAPEWRPSADGDSEAVRSGIQLLASGEWTQVILVRGIDSLQNDSHVEVIYGNTPDRPARDIKGNFLAGQSFSLSDTPPRHRNVLRGRIVNGVLTTDTQDIILAQSWGQGGARDIRGNRTVFDFRRGKLRLTLHTDGSATGLVGGYRPVFDVISGISLGGVGTATVAGIDCASQLATMKKLADGMRDPKTGQCTAISSAYRITAIPAFVNDIPAPIGHAD